MTKHTKKGAGGKKPQKYGERTVTVFGVRVPFKKESEYRLWHSETCKPLIKEKLKSFEVNPNKQK